jgi:hypothetical protein
MLTKDPSARPTAAAVYTALLPLTTAAPGQRESRTAGEKAGPFGIEESRDPTRAASVLDAAGHEYRRYFPPYDPVVLDCAYYAGHAYAETGKAAKALPQLRFYMQNADTSPGGDEARKILETRFVIAQLLAADGYPDEALAELEAVRPLLADAFGPESTQVRNLDKQANRLKTQQ